MPLPVWAREDYTDVGTLEQEDAVPLLILTQAPTHPPSIAPVARRGLLGAFMDLVDPHTESDPAALLIQWLVAFGSVVGRGPHCVADGAAHHANLFTVLVAPTAKGRKGTSWAHVRRLFQMAMPDWTPVSGLASGEGLIYHTRDASYVQQACTERGRPTGVVESTLQEAGVDDKRLCVVEAEFARVLKVCDRQGATLSAVLREAWDTGSLASLTRQSPLRATNAHVSVIGHITAEELRRCLTSTEIANGFGNRFLWLCAKRSKLLPDGGDPNQVALAQIARELADVVQHAVGRGRVDRSPQARDRWHAEYPALSEGKPGLFGSLTGRAEAHVVRLSLLYALLDRAAQIEEPHLAAALEVWRYSAASAAYVFGESLGHKTADDLLAALRAAGGEGISRTAITRDVFGRNRSAADIQDALRQLFAHGLVRGAIEESTAGRPTEHWYAVSKATKETN